MKDITLEEAHAHFTNVYPLYNNPELNRSGKYVEMLISCRCGAKYRIFVNGDTPIVPVPGGIECKNCGELAKNQTISGHSAGVFNATARRI